MVQTLLRPLNLALGSTLIATLIATKMTHSTNVDPDEYLIGEIGN